MTDVGTVDPMAASMERVLEMVGRPGSPLADAALWHLVVLGNEGLTEDYRRLTFGGPDLDKFAYRPGQDLMLRIPTSQGRLTHRRYTIRRADRRRLTLDIDVVVHGDGPGARWAATAEPGAELDTIGPRGSVTIADAADWHLFVGDETALPGMLAMAEALPAGVPATVIAELPRVVDAHWPDLSNGSRVDLRWLERGDAPPGEPDRLVTAATAVPWPGEGRGHAYLAGEMRVVRAVAARLHQRGPERDQLSAKAYWRRDAANAAHGEPLKP